ncbi:hypothetical protein [Longimicrobium sp.]|nr:hypothetical protein [Longimicrobium sp.]HSU15718.1 hypothetical protein [Longimicrobium sp.]
MSDPKEFRAEDGELSVEELEAAAGGDGDNLHCTINTNCTQGCLPTVDPQ